jgi:hypothetical protein
MSTPLSLVLEDLLPLIAEQERSHPEVYPASSIQALLDAGIIATSTVTRLEMRR